MLTKPNRLWVAVGQPEFPGERLVVSLFVCQPDGVMHLIATQAIPPTDKNVTFEVPLPADPAITGRSPC